MQARYYDPVTSRYLNADPLTFHGEFDEGAGIINTNVFAYCANNPIINKDPSGKGLITCIIVGAIIGAVIGGGIGAAYSYNKYRTIRAKHVFIGAFAGAIIGGFFGYAIGVAAGVSSTSAATAKGFASGFKISTKISGQLAKRGWTNALVKDTILKNVGRSAINKATGKAATAYFTSSGAYVVIDNLTREIIQISNRFDSRWIIDVTIKLTWADLWLRRW